MSGVYAADGSLNVTVVSGSTLTGLYAANGSINVVVRDGNTYTGIYAPCGAWNVYLVTSGLVGYYSTSGAINVAISPYVAKGAVRITVVSGSIGNYELREDSSFELREDSSHELREDALLAAPATPTLTLISGASDNTPDFTLDGDLVVNDVVRFQYSTSAVFSGASEITNTIDVGEDAANTLSFATGSLTDGTWYFRARIERSSHTSSDWSNTETETIDATAPTISSVALTSSAGADNTYKAGDVVSATIMFSEAVTVTGAPQLTLNVGGSNKTANYASGTGTTALVFSYTIQAGDTDTNGISIGANALALNSGTIRDAASNNATLTHSSVADNASHKVDTTAPTVSSFSPADNATGVAANATLTATFSETVSLGASGTITLKKTSDNSTIKSWDVATDGGSGAGKVEVLTNTALTLHLTSDLAGGIEFYVVWDAGVVKDAAGNDVAALSTTTTWSFTTVSSDSVAYTNFIARTSGLNAPHLAAYKALLDGLTTDGFFDGAGVSTKLDYLRVVSADATTDGLNLVANRNSLVIIGSPVFTPDQGYACDGSNYFHNNLNSSIAGLNATASSLSFGFWDNAAGAGPGGTPFFADTGGQCIYPCFGGTTTYFRNNGDITSANTVAKGFYASNRNGTAVTAYKNGSNVGSATLSVGSLANSYFYSVETDQILATFVGAHLSPTEHASLYARVHTYLQTISGIA